MKSYGIGLIFIIILFFSSLISFGSLIAFAKEADVYDDATIRGNEETKKPDQDKEDLLSGAEVTIFKSKQRTIEEYRVNGKLIQVKIIPKYGYPYYLIDTDGNGSFDIRSSEAWKNTTVNTWRIFQW